MELEGVGSNFVHEADFDGGFKKEVFFILFCFVLFRQRLLLGFEDELLFSAFPEHNQIKIKLQFEMWPCLVGSFFQSLNCQFVKWTDLKKPKTRITHQNESNYS